ncbi:ABC transporter permease, partial [Halobacteriales archaeon QS_7_68_65]
GAAAWGVDLAVLCVLAVGFVALGAYALPRTD